MIVFLFVFFILKFALIDCYSNKSQTQKKKKETKSIYMEYSIMIQHHTHYQQQWHVAIIIIIL